jgi:hypothetical protein
LADDRANKFGAQPPRAGGAEAYRFFRFALFFAKIAFQFSR